jgi:hypothetical protein
MGVGHSQNLRLDSTIALSLAPCFENAQSWSFILHIGLRLRQMANILVSWIKPKTGYTLHNNITHEPKKLSRNQVRRCAPYEYCILIHNNNKIYFELSNHKHQAWSPPISLLNISFKIIIFNSLIQIAYNTWRNFLTYLEGALYMNNASSNMLWCTHV